MTENFCTHCGTQLTDKAVFCHMCGSKIEFVKGVAVATPVDAPVTPPKQKVPAAAPVVPVQPVYRRPKAIGVGVLIAICILVPIILIGVFGSINFVDVGELYFDIDTLTETNIVLNIDNSVGSVDISYDVSATKLFDATIEVKGRPGASLDDAKNFQWIYESGVAHEITFDSGDYGFFFWNKQAFTYDITIKLHPDAVVDYSIITSTGSSSLVSNGIDNLDITDIWLSASTGRVTLDLSGSINTTIGDLDLDSSTGRISANLGERTTLETTNVNIETSTGGLNLAYKDIIFTGDIDWVVQTSTGSIVLTIEQNLVLPLNFTAAFDVDTSTGSITMNVAFNSTIGYYIEGATSTGSVDILGSGSAYTSPGYASADNQFTFDLETSTGSVTAVYL